MASGSGAGEPGGHLGPGDLAPDEERLLAALERDTGGDPLFSVSETVAAGRAAEDEAPSPAGGAPADDGLNPLFLPPAES